MLSDSLSWFKNINKIDQILIDNKNFYNLFDWWVNIHESKIVSFSPVLEEGLIASTIKLDKKEDCNDYNNFLHFKHVTDKIVDYHILRKDNDGNDGSFILLLSVQRNYDTFKYTCSYMDTAIEKLSLEDLSKFVDANTNVHPAIMNYMEFYKEERERVIAHKNLIPRTKKTKNNKKKKNVRPITNFIYKINPLSSSVSEHDKKEYKRMTESWSVRGHWRNLQNGNKIWIRPYIKGDKDKLEPTLYNFMRKK